MGVAYAPHRRSVEWLFVAVVIGYPVAGLASSLLNVESQVTSIPFRILVLTLSIWVLSTCRNPGLHKGGVLLAGFGLAYMCRVAWDTFVMELPVTSDPFWFYTATVFVPALALWLGAPYLEERRTTWMLFSIGSLTSLAAVLMYEYGIGADRALTELTGRLSFEALNPISLGHAAVTTLIAGLCLAGAHVRKRHIPFLIVGGVSAGAVLLLAVSRGPLICLLGAGVAYALTTRRWVWVFVLAIALLPFALSEESAVLARFANMEEDQSYVERVVLQTNAIDQFLEHPLLGSSFLELEFLTYPHNLVIETAMAMGVLGLLLLAGILILTPVRMYYQLRSGRILVPMLFVQYLLAAQLSGAIYGHSGLAACCAVLLALQLRRTPRATSSATVMVKAASRPHW